MSNKANKWAKIRAKAKAEAKAQAKIEAKAKKKKILIAVVAVVAVLAVALSVWLIIKPHLPVKGADKGITVSIIFKDNKMWATTFHTNRDYLGDALVDKGLVTLEDLEDGKIDTIKGETADWEADHAVWKLYINAEEAEMDIHKAPLESEKDYRLEYTIVE